MKMATVFCSMVQRNEVKCFTWFTWFVDVTEQNCIKKFFAILEI